MSTNTSQDNAAAKAALKSFQEQYKIARTNKKNSTNRALTGKDLIDNPLDGGPPAVKATTMIPTPV